MAASDGKLMFGWPAAAGRQWLKCLIRLSHCYAALLDPRPDLAVPARRIRTPYAVWWW